MTLREKIPAFLADIKALAVYLEHTRIVLDIYSGNLRPYVDQILKETLTEDYYRQIKSRMVLINVLRRITEKTSRAYQKNPSRFVSDQRYEGDVRFYEAAFNLDVRMQQADEYTSLFKAYALEPFVHLGRPMIRALPFDRFLPFSDDDVDPTHMTVFIKFMGKRIVIRAGRKELREIYHAVSDTEFLSFDSEGDVVSEDMEMNQGINPYGVIPFLYADRASDQLIPTQDTDTLSLTKIIPVMLSDLAGAVMFQCFSVVYGIDVNAENLKMSPNAFWSLKSDAKSDKQPTIGSIKPEADIDQVMKFISDTFSMWLETRGIRTGSMGSMSASNMASGISKIIDELDATELVEKSQRAFVSDEVKFWHMLGRVQNYWVTSSQITETDYKTGIWPDDLKVVPQFEKPAPIVDRKTQVDTAALEVEKGLLPRRMAIKRLNPSLSDEDLVAWVSEIDQPVEIAAPETEPVE